MPKLRNWALRGEGLSVHLAGDVYGHPRFADGDDVVTSRIVDVNEATGVMLTKSGTFYTLEGPPESGFAGYYAARENKDPTHPLTKIVDAAIAKAKAEAN